MAISETAPAAVDDSIPPVRGFQVLDPVFVGVKAATVGPEGVTPTDMVLLDALTVCSRIKQPKQVPKAGPPLFFVLLTVSVKLG